MSPGYVATGHLTASRRTLPGPTRWNSRSFAWAASAAVLPHRRARISDSPAAGCMWISTFATGAAAVPEAEEDAVAGRPSAERVVAAREVPIPAPGCAWASARRWRAAARSRALPTVAWASWGAGEG